MEDWKGVIAGLEYLLQFRSDPEGAVSELCESILSGTAIADEPEDVLAAIEQALASREDLTNLIPQPHSNELLRKVLAGLRSKLAVVMRGPATL